MNEAADPRIALVQMNCRLGDPEANLRHADQLLERLEEPLHLACLPETCDVGYDLASLGERLFELAEPIPGPRLDQLAELARRHGCAIAAGVVERDARMHDVLYDTTVLLDRSGRLCGRYRKSHLYPDEHRFFRAGDELPVFDLDGLRVGVATCFELAFPPVFSTLARRGAKLIVNPSAVPVGYGYLQDVRTPARAQDNQVFVAAINHVGREGRAHYCGGSIVADPRGSVLVRASDEDEDVVAATLPLRLVSDQRRQEPVFRGFRPDLYEF